MESTDITKKRLLDLAKRSYEGGYYLFSDFLDLAGQADLATVRAAFGNASYTTFGGADGAERVMARFGSEEELGYSEDFPIACIKCEPKSMKFADKLTHRDFLGALMNLSIKRESVKATIITTIIIVLYSAVMKVLAPSRMILAISAISLVPSLKVFKLE